MTTHLANAETVTTNFLRAELAELRKTGAGLDRVVKLLNAGVDPARITNIVESALEEFSAGMRKHQLRLADFKELLLLETQDLGLRNERETPEDR